MDNEIVNEIAFGFDLEGWFHFLTYTTCFLAFNTISWGSDTEISEINKSVEDPSD